MSTDITLKDIETLISTGKLSETDMRVLEAQLTKLERLKGKELSQQKFIKFVEKMWPLFISGAHHKRMAEAFERVADGTCKRLIINLPPRHAIVTSTKIPTLSGMKTVASLCVGDSVFGPDGEPAQVLGKSEVFLDRQIYRVTTDDNASIEVDGEHIWTVRLCRDYGVFHDYTTEQLWRRQNGEILKTKRGGGAEFIAGKAVGVPRLPMLPKVLPVQYMEKNLLVDPYVLGVWLGDGSRSSGVIAAADSDAVFTRAEIERRGYTTTDQATPCSFGVLGLQVQAKELGVYRNKHIPQIYLEGSVQQRRDLLKGLMDTDGNVSKAGQCFFAQSNRAFIEQVAGLVRSLGIKANILESEAKIGDKSYGPAWKVSFYANDVFLLPRKEERTLKGERKFGRYIKIEKLEATGDTQCIKVDREDGLFLAGEGYICTHNTKSEFASYLLPAWFLGKFPHKKVIQASHTAELAVGFGRKVRNLVDSDTYNDIFPDLHLQADSKAAGRWNTSKGGDYFAIGVGGAVTGKGADVLIIDDPHALATNTLVPTTEGFKTVADIKVGDKVFGPDGQPTSVVAKSKVWDDRQIYEVTTDDGATVECDGGHLWNHRTDTKLSAPHANSTTRALAAWDKASKPCLPRHAPVEYPEALLVVDPYVLGAWLGDGTVGLGRMTSHPDDMGFMRQQFEQAGYTTTTLTDPYSFGVLQLRAHLHQLGVRDNKRIPEQYLTASVAQRMALLQGLMDTDGDVTEAGQCSFNNCNKVLAQQCRELVHSLGVKAGLRRYEDARPNHNPVYRVSYKLRDCCRMERKNKRTYTPTDKRCRSITVTQTTRTAAVQCLTVDRADGLFLVGRDYIVTHNSEQEAAIAASNPGVYDKTYEWYTSGPRQRLQPGGAIIIVATRWSQRDLVGQVLKAATARNGEEWEVIEFPAILPSGNPLWPQFWSIEELSALQRELPNSKWQAQYQQNPVGNESAIVKRDWWRIWDKPLPPKCDYILQTWDTAFEKNNRADYSAGTTWGIFNHDEDNGMPNIILLNTYKKRVEYPDLKRDVLKEYAQFEPDGVLIEKKASGAPLIYDLRAMGIPVQEYTPGKGQDKIARLNAVSDIIASGKVWVPETRWAEELIDEVAEFPSGAHDDLVDATTLALMRFRQGGFLRLPSDEPEDIQWFKSHQRDKYYTI